MASIKDIFSNPREFLKMNLLTMMGNGPPVADVYKMKAGDLTDLGFSCTRTSRQFWKSDYKIRVWGIWPQDSKAQTETEELPAFWLPFSPNTIQQAQVDDMAPFMLTASMTGCTFGARRFANGMTQVCHANYQDQQSGQLDKSRMSRETASYTNTLEDSGYREQIKGKAITDIGRQSSLGATVVGVNTKNGWKFYAQQWENLDGCNYRYHKLIDI